MKPKKLTKKMLGGSYFEIECTCGCDEVAEQRSGSFYVEKGYSAICPACGQVWEWRGKKYS